MNDEMQAGAPPAGTRRSRPSLVLVYLLGVILCGLGHVYAGRVLRGFLLFSVRYLILAPITVALTFFATTPWRVAILMWSGVLFSLVLPVDGILAVRRHPVHRWRFPIRLAVALSFAAFGFATLFGGIELMRTRFVSVARIPTGAMRPTFLPGDVVLIDRRASATQALALGDVIVFRFPPKPEVKYMKRIAGLPGQSVEVREGCLIVDGNALCRPDGAGIIEEVAGRHYRINGGPMQTFGPVTVPEGRLFVLGDNRPESADSRLWGFLPRDHVLGKVHHVLWSAPMDAGLWSFSVQWEQIGTLPFEGQGRQP